MEWEEKTEVKKGKIYNLFRCGYLDVREWLLETDIVLIPLGSTEQHGRHLPVCTDSIATEVPCMLAAELANVPYYQLIPFVLAAAPASGGHGVGDGHAERATYQNVLYEVGRSSSTMASTS
jgi:creatinine amidohydrolase